ASNSPISTTPSLLSPAARWTTQRQEISDDSSGKDHDRRNEAPLSGSQHLGRRRVAADAHPRDSGYYFGGCFLRRPTVHRPVRPVADGHHRGDIGSELPAH